MRMAFGLACGAKELVIRKAAFGLAPVGIVGLAFEAL